MHQLFGINTMCKSRACFFQLVMGFRLRSSSLPSATSTWERKRANMVASCRRSTCAWLQPLALIGSSGSPSLPTKRLVFPPDCACLKPWFLPDSFSTRAFGHSFLRDVFAKSLIWSFDGSATSYNLAMPSPWTPTGTSRVTTDFCRFLSAWLAIVSWPHFNCHAGALPTSGTPSRLLPMESPQRGYDKFIVALRDKPNYVRTLVHRWLWQEKAVVEAYDGHQVIQTLFSSAGYVFKDQTLLGGPLQDVGGMFTCPFCPHRFQHRQSLQAHLWRKHQETSLERKYVTGPVCKACGKCFWTPQRAQQHLSRSRLHGTACFRTLFEHETPLNEPARFQPPERLIGVCRLPAVQTQSPAQWETSAWQRAQADALQDWQNRWQALDLPDTLPPEWYEQCEDQLDRVTSCWLTLPPDQRFDISDAWLMVLSSLEARHVGRSHGFSLGQLG